MYSSLEKVVEKNKGSLVGRLNYLQQLVLEFQQTSDQDARRQVLANLANFAYDPVNSDYLRRLNVTDLFLDSLDETDEKIVEFASAGLCNLSNDPAHRKAMMEYGLGDSIANCLASKNTETVLSALTLLINFVNACGPNALSSDALQSFLFRNTSSSNPRLRNLVQLLNDAFARNGFDPHLK